MAASNTPRELASNSHSSVTNALNTPESIKLEKLEKKDKIWDRNEYNKNRLMFS